MEREPSPESVRRTISPRLSLLLRLCALGFIALAFVKHGIYRPLKIHGVDYPKHWHAARAVLENRSTYLNHRPDDDLWLGFNYPQWSAMVTCWLAFFDVGTAEIIWKGMQLAALALAWAIAWKAFAPGRAAPDPAGEGPEPPAIWARRAVASNWGLAVAVMVAGYSPALASSLYTGQVDPANALLATAFVAALLAGWPFAAGIYLAMLCLVKMIPVFILLPLLLWRQWRALAGWLALMAGYAFTLWATGRIKHEWFFVHEMAKEIPFHWRWISGSLHRFMIKGLLPPQWHDTRELFDRAVFVVTAGLAAIYVASIYALRRRGWGLMRAVETALLFVPLFSPLFEPHHMSWAIPALFLHARRWCRGGMRGGAAAAYAAGWGVVSLDYFFSNLMQTFGGFGIHQYYVMGGAVWLVIASMAEAMAVKPEAPGGREEQDPAGGELAVLR